MHSGIFIIIHYIRTVLRSPAFSDLFYASFIGRLGGLEFWVLHGISFALIYRPDNIASSILVYIAFSLRLVLVDSYPNVCNSTRVSIPPFVQRTETLENPDYSTSLI